MKEKILGIVRMLLPLWVIGVVLIAFGTHYVGLGELRIGFILLVSGMVVLSISIKLIWAKVGVLKFWDFGWMAGWDVLITLTILAGIFIMMAVVNPVFLLPAIAITTILAVSISVAYIRTAPETPPSTERTESVSCTASSVEERISNYKRSIENARTRWSNGEISDYDYEMTVSTIEEKIDKLREEASQPAGKVPPPYEKKPTITETRVSPKGSTATLVRGGVFTVIGFILFLYGFSTINQFETSLGTFTGQVSTLLGGIFAIIGFVMVIRWAVSRREVKVRMVR